MGVDQIGHETENNDDRVEESSSISVQPIPELKGLANQRIEWIVVLRALACMAVVMNHVIGCCIVSPNSVGSLLNKVFLYPFCLFAVPVFIMISGCLLLNPKREVSLKKIISYMLRIMCLGALFGFFYCLSSNLYTLNSKNFFDFITKLPTVIFHSCKDLILNDGSHLWYLVILIGLYVVTPVLRIFVKHADKKTSLFILLLLFVTTCVIPTINDYFDIYIFTFANVDKFIFIYLVGYYLAYTDLIKDKYIYVCGIIGIVFFVIACCFGVSDQLDMFMILEAMMIFRMFSSGKLKIKNNKIINCLSKYSLGIYLIHPFWLDLLLNLKIHITIFPIFVVEFIFFFYAMIMSLLTSMILYRLPLIKKLFVK
ncbi:MAG: acyltransferase family protein [Clostridia bacterium]|nr:acyltransferase family protein [Clostridia bacterium]